jgi:hypothetical protein
MRYRLLFILFPCTLSAQGPLDGYLKGKGVFDFAPSFSVLRADRFIGAGDQAFEAPYRGSMLSIFGEYGLADNFDLVATGAFVFTETQNGLQDGSLYAKYRPVYAELGKTGGRLGVLIGAGATFPLSNYAPTATGALGQRAVAAQPRLIVQWDSPFGPFLNLTGGYNIRLDQLREADIAAIRATRPDYRPVEPSDYTTFLIKAGLPAARYYLDAWVEWQHARGGVDYAPQVLDLPQAYGVSYIQVGGTAYYSENGKTGFFVSGSYIPGGRNVSKILRLTGGLVVKFSKKAK